jgi:2-iminobutanoate/2-iminopropanoate deaminase
VLSNDLVSGAMPVALGPYSPVKRAGNLIFVSAQVGIDQETRQVPGRGFASECRQAFANLVAAVRAAGAQPSDVVKVTVLFVNSDDFPAVNKEFQKVFPVEPPARTTAIVGLAGGLRIAVDAIAVVND